MKTPSDSSTEWEALRAKIIGLGERSLRKSYYPELERRLIELERFRALLDQSNDLIFLAQIPSGRFADVNESACRQLGYARAALLAMSIGDLVPRPIGDKMAALLADEGQVGQAGVTIVTTFNFDGGKMPVEMSVRLVAFSDAAYAVIVARDITERKRAEEALREREQHAQSLVRLSKQLERAQTYAEILDAASAEVRNTIGYQNLWVYLLSEDKKYFKALVAGGPTAGTVTLEEGLATLTIAGDRMLEEIAEARGLVVVEEARTDPRTDKEIVARLGNRTIVNVPIVLFDKNLGSVGTGSFGDEGVRVPTQSEQEFLTALASHLAVSLDRVHSLAERERATIALRESEERIKRITENAKDFIYRMSVPDGKYEYVNSAVTEITGYTPAEFYAQPLLIREIIHPDWRQYFEEQWSTLLEGQAPPFYEYQILHKSGQTRWINQRNVLIKDREGIPIALEGIGTDTTDHKQAEQEHLAHLRFLESLDRVNRVIQRADDLERLMSDVLDSVLSIFDCDRAWLVYPCDPEAASWRVPMERTRPEFPGIFASGLEAPMAPDVVKVIQTVRAASGPVRFGPGSEHSLGDETPKRFHVQSMMAMAVYPKVDKPYMFGLHQCSSPRLWTPEEERLFQEIGRRLADALTSLLAYGDLQESERKLAEAQRIAHVGYWDHNIGADRISGSDETHRIFGTPQAHILNFARFLELVHPEDRPNVVQAAAAARRGDPPYDLEYRVVRPDGQVRFVHNQWDVKRDESGRPRHLFGTVQDITELRQAEDKLRASEARFRALVDHAADAFFLFDDQGAILDANRQACESLGYTREELIAMTPLDFDVDA
ncbi:MAG: PAS domain S-box protein, partial [Chloroflexota bacterium]